MLCYLCATSSGKPLNFATKDQLEAHISDYHFNFLPYECLYCPFDQFPTKHLLQCHHDSVHQLQQFEIVYSGTEINFAEKRRKIELALEQSKKYTESALTLPSCSTSLIHDQLPNIRKEDAITIKNEPLIISNSILGSVSPSHSTNEIRLQCNKCFEYVMAQPSKQLDHVNIRHCKYPLYCCTECDISFNSIDQFDSHCILTHSSDCFTLKSNLDKYAAELSRKCQALFYGQGDCNIQNYESNQERELVIPKNELNDIRQPSISDNISSFVKSCINDSNDIKSFKECSKRKIGSTLLCTACKKPISNILLNLLMHMNKHLKYPIRRCIPCNEIFLYTSGNATNHVRNFHNGDQSVIENNSKKYQALLKNKILEFYPDYRPM